jgi:hypothetical protein
MARHDTHRCRPSLNRGATLFCHGRNIFAAVTNSLRLGCNCFSNVFRGELNQRPRCTRPVRRACYSGIAATIRTDSTRTVTIRHSDNAPTASEAATELAKREWARTSDSSNPCPNDIDMMFTFKIRRPNQFRDCGKSPCQDWGSAAEIVAEPRYSPDKIAIMLAIPAIQASAIRCA